jgi:hypothetical protein
MATRHSASRAFSWKKGIIGGVGISVMLLALIGMLTLSHMRALAAAPGQVTHHHMAPRISATPPPPPWLDLAIHIKNPLPSGNYFTADDVFPDASAIVGSGAPQNSQVNTVEYVTLADKQEHPIITLPSDVTEPEVVTDGLYIAWVSGKGVAGIGQNHRQLAGYYNITTGQIITIPPTAAYGIAFDMAADHGDLLFLTTANTLMSINMPAGITSTVTLATNVSNLVQIQIGWPYVTYATNDLVLHLYDLATNQDMTLPQVTLNPLCMDCVALAGTTVFWANLATNGSSIDAQVYEIDHANQPGATSKLVTTLTNIPGFSNLWANDRLILWTTGDIQVWDRLKATLYDIERYHTTLFTSLGIHGNGFFFPTYGQQSISVNIIDTSKIPTS